jgi:hypothetical protein
MLRAREPRVVKHVAARVAMLAVAACTGDRSPREAATGTLSSDAAAAVPGAPPDSAVVGSARVALGAFLEASREGSATRAARAVAQATARAIADSVAARGAANAR